MQSNVTANSHLILQNYIFIKFFRKLQLLIDLADDIDRKIHLHVRKLMHFALSTSIETFDLEVTFDILLNMYVYMYAKIHIIFMCRNINKHSVYV